HRNGVVHRDLKPDNIVVAELGDTVVIDWGLALEESDPFGGGRVGTAGFMAPEQGRGERREARADGDALGTTLYFMLAGVAATSTRLVDAEPGVPRDLAAIVDKARAASPAARYPSAVELAAELQRFIAGQLVGAHHYTWPARIGRQI